MKFSFLPAAAIGVLSLLAGCKGGETARGENAANAAGAVEQVEARFFYDELCASCRTDEERFLYIVDDKLSAEERGKYPHAFVLTNIYGKAGREVFVRETDRLGLDRENLQTPCLILGGRVFQGYDSIAANIREAYLTAGEDVFVNKKPYNPKERKTGAHLFDEYPVSPASVAIVYFYRITCDECAQTTPLIDALPERVVTADGKERPLDILRINTRSGNNGERAAAFFEAWDVPDEDRMVPIVFFADSYLAGVEAISEGLLENLSKPRTAWKLLPTKL